MAGRKRLSRLFSVNLPAMFRQLTCLVFHYFVFLRCLRFLGIVKNLYCMIIRVVLGILRVMFFVKKKSGMSVLTV